MRLIDADKLKAHYAWWGNEEKEMFDSIVDVQPTVDAVPVVHGEWRDKMLDNFRKYEVVCSVCGARYIGNYDAYDEPWDFNYCPNCGAKMDGGVE